ncbi:MAG: DUF4124 domain-containing protein [Gammaproteobacteria bacterium]|nr:DUF4124 domain-containing protein [Gammaproteobacteria bacterium]
MKDAGMALGLVFLLASGLAGADVYRWKDENGRVHFGDRPGAVRADKIDVPDGERVLEQDGQQQLDAERAVSRQRLLDAYREERESKQREQEAREARERERESRCIYARDILRGYQESGSIYQPLASGERRYLSATERREEIDRARADVAHWCDD